MRRGRPRIVAVAALLVLLTCGTAYALRAEIGNNWVSAVAEVQPHKLPARGGAPVTLTSVTRIGTKDGSRPPALKTMRLQFDKHGFLDVRGLPVCTEAKLADATPAQARRRCAGALVGKGTGKARVELPGAPPVTVSSPLSFFNGPRVRGRPTVIAHAYETLPQRKALLASIRIERVKRGRYGYMARIELPEIAGGYGSATLAEAKVGGAIRKRGRRSVGYINARCAGGRLQVYGTLSFQNGDFFPATLASSCRTPG